MNDLLALALSANRRTDPSDTGEDGSSCIGDWEDSTESVLVGVCGEAGDFASELISASAVLMSDLKSTVGLTGERGGGDSANGLVGKPEMYSSAMTFVLSSGGVNIDDSMPGKVRLGTLPDVLKMTSGPGLKEKARWTSGLDFTLSSLASAGTGSSSQSLCIVLLDLTVPISDSG